MPRPRRRRAPGRRRAAHRSSRGRTGSARATSPTRRRVAGRARATGPRPACSGHASRIPGVDGDHAFAELSAWRERYVMRARSARHPTRESRDDRPDDAGSDAATTPRDQRDEARCDSRTRSRSSPAAAAGWAGSPPSCSRRRGPGSSSPSTARRRARRRSSSSAPTAARRPSSRPTCRRRRTRRRWSTTPLRRYGRLDCLYNNAGVMPEADHSVTDTDVDVWDQVMAVNVRGVFLGCKYAIPAMVSRRRRVDHQHRELRGARRLLRAAGRLHRVEGRGPVPDPQPGRPVRPEGHPDQRDLPGSGRDAAADGLAGQGRGGQASCAWRATRPAASASPRRSSTWRSTSPRTSRAGRTAPRSSSTAGSPSTTSDRPGRIDDRGDSRRASRSDRHRRRCRRQRDQGGRRRRGCRAVPLRAPARPDADPVDARAVAASIGRLVQAPGEVERAPGETTPVGVGLPGVTIGRRLKSAANIDPAWVDFPVVEQLSKSLKRPVSIVNDADAAGIAEMRFGVGAGKPGVVDLPDPRDRCRVRSCSSTARSSRTPSSGRWRSAAGRPSGGPRRPPRTRARPVVEGLGDGPRRAPRPHRAADVADPVDPRRRRQQERRQVRPAADRALRRSSPAQLRNDAGIIGAAIVAAEGLAGCGERPGTTCRAAVRPAEAAAKAESRGRRSRRIIEVLSRRLTPASEVPT